MNFKNESKFKNYIGIYEIRNLINDHVYIGQTGESFQRRYFHHRYKLKNGTHDNQHLQNAWNKYGEENFEFRVVELSDSIKYLDDMEIFYIALFREKGICYNILDGGGGIRGFKMPIEIRRLIGEKNRERMIGTKLSKETKEKMSKARKGVYHKRKTDVIDLDSARAIKNRLINGESASSIANDLDISYKAINGILSNDSWSQVKVEGWEEFKANRKTWKRMSKQDHEHVYKDYVEYNMSKYELSEKYGKSIKTIELILRKQKEQHENPVSSLNIADIKED